MVNTKARTDLLQIFLHLICPLNIASSGTHLLTFGARRRSKLDSYTKLVQITFPSLLLTYVNISDTFTLTLLSNITL